MTRAEQRAAKLQREADAWNAANPVGTVVRYWRGVREGAPSGTGPTYHKATILSGHTVVAWITGCSGCITVSHVEAVEPGGAS